MRRRGDDDKAGNAPIPIPKWWDRFDLIIASQLSGKQKLAMLVIAGFAGDTNECFASRNTLARAMSVEPGTASRTTRELEDAGFIERIRRQNRASIFKVQWSRFGWKPQLTESANHKNESSHFGHPELANARVDTSSLNTPKNTPSNKREVSRFVPPSVEEVAAYCRERGNTVDAELFIDHYTANGWMRGRTKLKDWRAAVRTWERNSEKWGSKQKPAQFSGTGSWAAKQEDLDR